MDERFRRQSLPAKAYSTLPSSSRIEEAQRRKISHQPQTLQHPRRSRITSESPSRKLSEIRHFGSSLSMTDGPSTSDLTRRTLAPPNVNSTLSRYSRAGTPGSSGSGGSESVVPPRKKSYPNMPDMSVQADHPKLAAYLEKPRLVSTSQHRINERSARQGVKPKADLHHRHHQENERPSHRNLRLGNFLESDEFDLSEGIPEVLRNYYLDTYLDVCDTCESKTHLNPTSPIQRGM